MAFLRRWLLILSALVLGGGPLCAASLREERTYAAALDAFHDKFYERAETGLTQFLQTYGRSTNAPMAVLLLAQSEFHLGNYTNTITRLTASNNLARAQAFGLADRYVYWTAEARFASGDYQGAAELFTSLPDKFSTSPLGLGAVVEAAAAYQKLGRWTELDKLLENPEGLFQRTARLDPASEMVADGRLLQAESKYVQRDFNGALGILKLLNPATLTLEQDWKRADQLCRASLGLDDLESALAATTNLLQIARHGQGSVWATNLAQSVASHAEVLEKQGRLTEAITAWQENLTNDVPVAQQQQAMLKMAELAVAQNELPDAEAGLEKFLAQFSSSPGAEFALLTLGEMHLTAFVTEPAATNHLATAHEKFDQLLGASTNSPLAGKAFLDRGWCHWLAGKLPPSLADFQSAAQLLPLSDDLAVARFKMGDAQFAQKDFAGAQTNYQAVLTDFSALPKVAGALGDRALYQILRVRLELQDAPGADAAMRELLDKYSSAEPADSSLLLAGEGFSDFGSPAKAREVYQQFEAKHPASPLRPQVAFAVARTFERELNWPAAVTNYTKWLTDFPTNELRLRSQVEYARNWAVFQTGDETNAFELFTQFISQFPTNSLTPLAHWWVADHFFRLGGTNFVEAERHYELIFQDSPTNELAYPAQLMAGRAAMGRFSYPEANRSYFIPLINDTNCPENLKVQARFAYCDALRQMASSDTNNANLQLATNILSQLCPLAVTNEAGALAWSAIGDCSLQLGAFDAATNAYAQAMNSPAAGAGLRKRAQVGLGLVLEKKAEGQPDEARKILLALALNYYQDVFYPKAEAAEEFWKKKAGLQMLELVKKTGCLKGGDLDDFITELIKTFPQLKDSLELKRLAVKN
jgi:TolA-binding protein